MLMNFFVLQVFGQERIMVSEGSIKIAGLGEENLYFAFASGDKIVFSFSETSGKEIKEVEILEYPSSSRYTEFKVSASSEKTVVVNQEGVFRFRFTNGSLGKRVCRYKIERIPASVETAKFGTTVKWVEKTDTSWNTFTKDVTIGYDTTFLKMTRKIADTVVQKEELVFDKSLRVHSETNENGNKTWIFFDLPSAVDKGYESRKVVAWAYWIGVGEEANKAWKENAKTLSTLTTKVAGVCLTPLGAFAAGALTELAIPKLGEDVYYALTDEENKDRFMYGQNYYIHDKGKGVAGYRKISETSQCQGRYFFCLLNDNTFQGIDVNVKVVAILETTFYKDEPYEVPIVKPVKEKQILSEPVITKKQVPVIAK